jgi:hypothetical protein
VQGNSLLRVHGLVTDGVVNGGAVAYLSPRPLRRVDGVPLAFCVALLLLLVLGLVACDCCLQPPRHIAQPVLAQIGQDQSLFTVLLWLKIGGRGRGGRQGGEGRDDRSAADTLAFLAPLPLLLPSMAVVMSSFQHLCFRCGACWNIIEADNDHN